MPESASQTIIITGAGAGIGQALAIGFVERGAHVVAISRGARGLDDTKGRCAGPGYIECHVIDVTDGMALDELFSEIVRRRGGIDLVINGAAIYPRQVLADTTPEEWAAGVATNLNGVVYGCRAAVRAIPLGRPAVILNAGSFAYLGPDAGSSLYCTTKAAVSAFTRALAAELASTGSSLIVNEWVPGQYSTRMSGYTGEDPGLAFERLLKVWELSKSGSGGRTFQEDWEVLPPRSLRSRLKALITGRRT